MIKKNNKQLNINKKRFFYKHFFYIDVDVFKPRFETEQLVDLTIGYINTLFKKQKLEILEIGTGSGVIALSLALCETLWKLHAVDISPKAIQLATKNLNLFPHLQVKIEKSDLFTKIKKKYHIIVANLPYVSSNYPLEKNVIEQDPAIALFSGLKGMDLINKFLQETTKYLKKKHLIALEFGYDQKLMLTKSIKKYLPKSHYIFKKDYAQNDRFVFIYSL